jgi:hypothetical protein
MWAKGTGGREASRGGTTSCAVLSSGIASHAQMHRPSSHHPVVQITSWLSQSSSHGTALCLPCHSRHPRVDPFPIPLP